MGACCQLAPRSAAACAPHAELDKLLARRRGAWSRRGASFPSSAPARSTYARPRVIKSASVRRLLRRKPAPRGRRAHAPRSRRRRGRCRRGRARRGRDLDPEEALSRAALSSPCGARGRQSASRPGHSRSRCGATPASGPRRSSRARRQPADPRREPSRRRRDVGIGAGAAPVAPREGAGVAADGRRRGRLLAVPERSRGSRPDVGGQLSTSSSNSQRW